MPKILSFFYFLLVFTLVSFGQEEKPMLGITTAIPESTDLGYLTSESSPRYGSYSIDNIPNPKERGQQYFVSNPDGLLNSSAVQYLDGKLQELEKSTGIEFAIVVVGDYEGYDIFSFSHSLFNLWGIGDKEKNSGLLLFIALNSREYRFVSGYGVEAVLPDVSLKRIGEEFFVPNFRNGDYDKGIIEATDFIIKILESSDTYVDIEKQLPSKKSFWNYFSFIVDHPFYIALFLVLMFVYLHKVSKYLLRDKEELPQFYKPIFKGCGYLLILMIASFIVFPFFFGSVSNGYSWNNFPYFLIVFALIALGVKIKDIRLRINASFKDALERDSVYLSYLKFAFIPMLISVTSWGALWKIIKSLIDDKDRFVPPDQSGNWERIVRGNNELENSVLTQGQRIEEKINSCKYEIWRNTLTSEVKTIPWEISHNYALCLKCEFYTLETNIRRVIRSASYSSTGEGELYDQCHHCSYKMHRRFYSISKKEHSSSSSRGGSSGGGGAGGRW